MGLWQFSIVNPQLSIINHQYFRSTGFQLVMVTGLYSTRGLPPV